ncbi:hypothetical protein Salat_2882400 [Sesamum alatum]|uniref:Uncharacterized protein n=1 Tax=Sesamum alatum TaxID=300844 RepID=A0AAE2C7Y3_9LAMI|nr:hypothetical protein Salat_2882400 [Sesamum alatum]
MRVLEKTISRRRRLKILIWLVSSKSSIFPSSSPLLLVCSTDSQAMASMKNLQDAWRLQFGDEVVALKPTSAHVLTPFRLPQPEIRRARRVLSRDSAVTFDIPSAACASLSASHSPAAIPLFSPENFSPSSAEYSLGLSLSIALLPGVFPPHFQADCSPSTLQQLLVSQSAPLAPSATLPPLMHEKSYKDALFTANFAAHSSLPAANFWPEKTVATSSYAAANSAAHPSLPAENFWSEKTAATSSCTAAYSAAHSSLPAANFWSRKTAATSCAIANSVAHSSLPAANFWPEKTVATSSCAAAYSATHPSLPADNFWPEKSDTTSCAAANSVAYSSLPAANFWPENSAPTSLP